MGQWVELHIPYCIWRDVGCIIGVAQWVRYSGLYILGTWLPFYLCPIVLTVGEQARAVGSLCCSLWSHLNWSMLVVRFKILLHTAHCPLPTAHCTLHVFAVPAPLSSISDFFLFSEQQPLYWHLSNLCSVWKSKANDWISLFLNPLQLTNTVIYQYFNLEFTEF